MRLIEVNRARSLSEPECLSIRQFEGHLGGNCLTKSHFSLAAVIVGPQSQSLLSSLTHCCGRSCALVYECAAGTSDGWHDACTC